MPKPCAHYLAAAHRVLRYLKGSAALGLFFSSTSSLEPSLFADADWAACADTRRSVSGYCLFLGSSLISWKSKKQQIVSRSSTEAEYRSMALATCELVWIGMLLTDFGISCTKVVPLFCDNKAAVYLTSNAAFLERTKHIEVDCHTVRGRYIQGLVKPMHVPSNIQLADIFTKPLPSPAFSRLLGKMGLRSIYSLLEGECKDNKENKPEVKIAAVKECAEKELKCA